MNSILSAFKGLKRNFSMASASIILVILTLLVMGSVVIIGLNAQKASKELIDSVSIYLYLDKDITLEQREELEDTIKKIPEVDGVTYYTADQQLEKLTTSFKDELEGIDDTFTGEDNPLYPVFEVSVADDIEELGPIVAQTQALPYVEKVDDVSSNSLEKLVSFVSGAQIVGIVVAVLLFAVSLFIITNTIRLAITSRRKEIEIMRLVGATKAYIRAPFIVEGFILGLIGGVISASALSLGYYNAYGSTFLATFTIHLVEPLTMIKYLYIVLITAGVVIGVIGSIIALRRHLRR